MSAGNSVIFREFVQFVAQNNRLSINMRPHAVANILRGRRHQNIYDLVAEQAELSGRDEDEIMREKLGSYYRRRVAFDQQFQRYRDFRYGSCNMGGLGPNNRYGPVCVLLCDEFCDDDDDVTCVKHDSLSDRYYDNNETLRPTRLAEDLSPIDFVSLLAGVKHGEPICVCPRVRWAERLCNDDDYVECIFTKSFGTADISILRVAAAEWQKMRSLAFDDYGRSLSPAEKAMVQDFTDTVRLARESNIVLEVV